MYYALGAVLFAALLVPFFYYQNNSIRHTRITLFSSKIDAGVRLVHISDLHSKIFSNNRLYEEVGREKPDFIVFTGDIADRYKSDKKAMTAVEELSSLEAIAPVFACSGNHEYGRLNREELFNYMEECGIELLRGDRRVITPNEEEIGILGLDELGYPQDTEELLTGFEHKKCFKLLLSHFPQRFEEEYSKYDIDLTLCGHAHGGQFILPFIGGVFAPGQGFNPKYYDGLYEYNGKKMIVSRGLGNSRFPLRLFNHPQIITIDLLPE